MNLGPMRAIVASDEVVVPAPRRALWLDVATVAIRLDLSARRVRQLCASEWAARGQAQQIREGDQLVWRVRDDAAPELARVVAPEHLPFDHGRLTDAQRATWIQRKRILGEWLAIQDAAVRSGENRVAAGEAYLDRVAASGGPRLSQRTLYLWQKAFRREGDAGIVDGRMNSGRKGRGRCAFTAEVERRYLDLRQPSIQLCYDLAAKRFRRQFAEDGRSLPSYATVRRRLQALPPDVVTLKRGGAALFTDDAEPYISRDYSPLRSNEIWCSDHHEMDVMIVSPNGVGHVRPWLTAWMDMRSRKIVGWVLRATDPNTETILAAFARGVRSHGVPETAYIDNGKDFDAEALQGRTKRQRRAAEEADDVLAGVFTALGMNTQHAQIYHGQSKPIERLFKTVEDRFGRLQDTYCGNSPENRPENLQAKLDAGQAKTLDELAAGFAEWVDNDYHIAAHAGDSMDDLSPAQVWDACLERKRTASESQLRTLLLRPTRPVKVTQNGVRVDGVFYGSGDPILSELRGREIRLRIDDADRTRVYAFELSGKYLCELAANRKLPANATSEQLRDAMRTKREARRNAKRHGQTRDFMHMNTAEVVAVRQAAKAAPVGPGGVPPPPSIVPVISPLEPIPDRARRVAMASGGAQPSFLEEMAAEPVLSRPRAKHASIFDVLSPSSGEAE